ncbi:MAG: NUDIX domain-containing protein [Polyangiaceae bacterium]|nr:NUDIX domain-containing protein [Polyangiaceae bacterium]
MRLGARGPELLALRVRAHAYELPKGHLEPGESPAEAARRELVEETNVLGVALALAPVGELLYELGPAASGRYKHVVSFVCMVASGEVTFGPRPSRTRERRWLTDDELDALPLVNEARCPIMRAALAYIPPLGDGHSQPT